MDIAGCAEEIQNLRECMVTLSKRVALLEREDRKKKYNYAAWEDVRDFFSKHLDLYFDAVSVADNLCMPVEEVESAISRLEEQSLITPNSSKRNTFKKNTRPY